MMASTTVRLGVRRGAVPALGRWRQVASDLAAMVIVMALVALPVFAMVGLAGTAFGGEPGCPVTASVDDLRQDFAALSTTARRA